MRDFYTLQLDMVERSIKGYRKINRINFSFLLLNLVVGLWNVSSFYYGTAHPLNAMGMGVSFTCCLYILLGIFETKGEMKFDREWLNRLKEMKESDTMKGIYEQYKNTTEYYEKLMTEVVKKNNPEKAETAADAHNDICKNVSASNCH